MEQFLELKRTSTRFSASGTFHTVRHEYILSPDKTDTSFHSGTMLTPILSRTTEHTRNQGFCTLFLLFVSKNSNNIHFKFRIECLLQYVVSIKFIMNIFSYIITNITHILSTTPLILFAQLFLQLSQRLVIPAMKRRKLNAAH